jgi:hypothetical protein
LETANGGSTFGLKFRNAGGSVQVKVSDASIVPGINLVPSPTAQAGDFFYLQGS